MRFVGALLFLLGGGGVAYSVPAMFAAARPRDVAFAVLAPVALTVALTGALLLFVPGFFGG